MSLFMERQQAAFVASHKIIGVAGFRQGQQEVVATAYFRAKPHRRVSKTFNRLYKPSVGTD
jgi:hypothetical protein